MESLAVRAVVVVVVLLLIPFFSSLLRVLREVAEKVC